MAQNRENVLLTDKGRVKKSDSASFRCADDTLGAFSQSFLKGLLYELIILCSGEKAELHAAEVEEGGTRFLL